MDRELLLNKLNLYFPTDRQEKEMHAQMLSFVEQNEDCFLRSNLSGHITGSALITDLERENVLLLHHKKLDKWLQPGGHADGENDILRVALKEVFEETGLKARPVSPEVFDIDVHEIPERKGVPTHLHYDLRFLLEVDKNEELIINNESLDLAWIPLEEVKSKNNEESILRMVRKYNSLFPKS